MYRRRKKGRESIGQKERFFIGGEKLKGGEKLSQGGVYIEVSKSKNKNKKYFFIFFLKKSKNA